MSYSNAITTAATMAAVIAAAVSARVLESARSSSPPRNEPSVDRFCCTFHQHFDCTLPIDSSRGIGSQQDRMKLRQRDVIRKMVA